MLKIGDKAPDISLPDQNQHIVRLGDFEGKQILVVYFYPKDGTTGCTAESCSFRDSYAAFSRHGAQVLGISQDGAASHQKFIADHSLPFPLLSDVDGTAAKSFGLKKTLGIIPARVTFVIDKQGIVQGAYSSQLKMKGHSEDALDVVQRISKV
jgi:peroxiredoxin Q/BCP